MNVGNISDNWAVATANMTSFTTPWKSPQAVLTVGSGVAPWTTPENASASDDTYAEAEMNGGDTEILRATQFGFTTSEIPSGATILGIEVGIERSIDSNMGRDSLVVLRTSQGQSGVNKADTVTDWTYSDTEIIYGDTSDDWSAALDDSDIRSSGFGLDFRANLNNWYPDYTANIDHIRVRVHGEF